MARGNHHIQAYLSFIHHKRNPITSMYTRCYWMKFIWYMINFKEYELMLSNSFEMNQPPTNRDQVLRLGVWGVRSHATIPSHQVTTSCTLLLLTNWHGQIFMNSILHRTRAHVCVLLLLLLLLFFLSFFSLLPFQSALISTTLIYTIATQWNLWVVEPINMCMLSGDLGTIPHVSSYTRMVFISTKLTH